MKAVCTSEARLNGLQFNPGEEYYFEEQVFTEEYIPAIHPQLARGHRIRYIRYKVALPMGVELDDLHGMTEVRTVYFYDRFYCLYHDWKDERGQATGFYFDSWGDVPNHITFRTPRAAFATLIDKVSGKGTWQRNPWVFAYEFELVK